MDDKIKKPYTILWVEDEENEGFENKLKEEYEIIKVKNIPEFNIKMQFPHKFDFAILDANIPRKENEEEKTVLVQLIQECDKNNLDYFILSAKISFDTEKFDQFSHLGDKIYKKKRKEIDRLLSDLKKHFNNNIISKYPNFYNSCKRGYFKNYNLWDKIEPFLEKYYSRGISARQFESDIDKNLKFNDLRKSFEDLLKYYKSCNFIPHSTPNIYRTIKYLSGNQLIFCKEKQDKEVSNKCVTYTSKKDYLNHNYVKNKEYVFLLLNDFLHAKSHRNDPDSIISSKKTIFFMYLEFMDYAIKLVETSFITTKEGYEPWEKEEVESCRLCQNK